MLDSSYLVLATKDGAGVFVFLGIIALIFIFCLVKSWWGDYSRLKEACGDVERAKNELYRINVDINSAKKTAEAHRAECKKVEDRLEWLNGQAKVVLGKARTQAIRIEKEARAQADVIVKDAEAQARMIFDEREEELKRSVSMLTTLEESLSDDLKENFPWLSKCVGMIRHNMVFAPGALSPRALKASEVLRNAKELNQKLQKRVVAAETLCAFYEYIYPDLLEIKTAQKQEVLSKEFSSQYSQQEREDPATGYLPRAEYMSRTPAERGDIALSRYWRRKKSSGEIGRAYERYVGYLYETQGYDVSFYGIERGKEDRGIDLICENDDEIVLVQCKNWAAFKSIFENVVFQFYGSVFHYKHSRKIKKKIRGVIYATTDTSEFVKAAIGVLKLKFVLMPMDYNYPCIKCNIGRSGEKIYHLPFDQQYDKVKIERIKGEFYAYSCADAESVGFRRAFRHYSS